MQKTEVGAQKMDDYFMKIYNIIITIFELCDKYCYFEFFQRLFLLADINKEVVHNIFSLIPSNRNVQFIK